jgi:DNA polymerase III epsilon subunit-like protein
MSSVANLPMHSCAYSKCCFQFQCFGLDAPDEVAASSSSSSSSSSRSCSCEQRSGFCDHVGALYFCQEYHAELFDEKRPSGGKAPPMAVKFERNAATKKRVATSAMSARSLSQLMIFFDTETTGLRPPQTVCIIEIGAMVDPSHCTDGGASVPREFSTLVRPDLSPVVPADAIAIHGITTEMLGGDTVPTFAHAWTQFVEWIQGWRKATGLSEVVLVAHNCYQFDRVMLDHACKRAGITQPRWMHFSDSVLVLRKLHLGSDVTEFSLQSLVRVLIGGKATGQQAHRALGDVKLLVQLITEGLPTHELVEDFYEGILRITQPALRRSSVIVQ